VAIVNQTHHPTTNTTPRRLYVTTSHGSAHYYAVMCICDRVKIQEGGGTSLWKAEMQVFGGGIQQDMGVREHVCERKAAGAVISFVLKFGGGRCGNPLLSATSLRVPNLQKCTTFSFFGFPDNNIRISPINRDVQF
jgi:hypothetical protein